MRSPYQLIIGTEAEHEELLTRGQELFRNIALDLNILAHKFTYSKHQVRGQAAYEEICMALALFDIKKDIFRKVLKDKKGAVVN